MRRVAIVGVGVSKFGYRPDVSLPELAWEAVKEALDDARLDAKDVEAYVVGNVGGWSSEPLPAVVVGEYCGLAPSSGIRVRPPAQADPRPSGRRTTWWPAARPI
jgi:Acetyl-CoA acetyltransferase